MTTQPHDLKKLREVTASLPDEASVNVHIAKLDELIGPLGYCSFEQAHAWAVLKFQISQLLAANPSALLDAYEASARDAERYRWIRNTDDGSVESAVIYCSFGEPYLFLGERLDAQVDAARHATQGD